MGGTRFSADNADMSKASTSERNPRLVSDLSVDENESPNAPAGYTRGMQDPKHGGVAMRSPPKPAWITAEHVDARPLLYMEREWGGPFPGCER